MYVSVGNLQESMIPYKLPMGKLVSVVKRVDVSECVVCRLSVMYVSVGNSQESVILYELPMGKLVGAVKRVDVREGVDCTLYVMYVGIGNLQESVIEYELSIGKFIRNHGFLRVTHAHVRYLQRTDHTFTYINMFPRTD